MGAYTCEYGVVHKVCRCPTPHTIKCDNVVEHKTKQVERMAYHHLGPRPCYRLLSGLVGKHESHPAHDFFYTSAGGGHYMDSYDDTEPNVAKHRCPGNECD